MANSTKPTPVTILLVHGIWHSPLTYAKLTTALQRAGHDVHAPFLPSCTGARPPTASLASDTQLIRRFAEQLADQGRAIVVVMHSYGGVVAAGALEGLDARSRAARGLRGGVAHLVGLAAHLHPPGVGVLDLVREMGDESVIGAAIDVADDGSCMSTDARVLLFGDVADEGEAAALVRTLSPANFDCLEAKVRFAAWEHIPVTYVHTTRDMTLPARYQRRMLEKMARAGAEVEVVELETGHAPYVTKMEEVVQVIENVVNKVV